MISNQIDKANIYIKENKHRLNHEYRHEYHLMGEYGWINDPNGFIQYKGMYHLFYQYHPYGAFWGPMHWGHSVSSDLVDWRHLPVALAPDSEPDRDGCFSGCAVEKDDLLYLMYTGHVYTGPDRSGEYRQTQCLAVSDDGISFNKFEGNPVIDAAQIPDKASSADFRDPKVLKKDDCYYSVLGSNYEGNGQILLYSSYDLHHWEYKGILAKSCGNMGYTWECPDVFSMQNKDVIMVSPQYMKPMGNDYHNTHSSIYMVGDIDFNEATFSYDKFHPVDYGFDFYAPQTILDNKGRRIMVGWMNMWETANPTQENGHNWAGSMTLARELVLKGDRIWFKPIKEIENYRKEEYCLESIPLDGEIHFENNVNIYELQVCINAGTAEEFGIKLCTSGKEETLLAYERKEKIFRFNRDNSGIGPKGERRTEIDLIENMLKLHIFVDKCSVEVFINDGEKVMTGRVYPSSDATGIKAFSKGACEIVSFKKWELRGAI